MPDFTDPAGGWDSEGSRLRCIENGSKLDLETPSRLEADCTRLALLEHRSEGRLGEQDMRNWPPDWEAYRVFWLPDYGSPSVIRALRAPHVTILVASAAPGSLWSSGLRYRIERRLDDSEWERIKSSAGRVPFQPREEFDLAKALRTKPAPPSTGAPDLSELEHWVTHPVYVVAERWQGGQLTVSRGLAFEEKRDGAAPEALALFRELTDLVECVPWDER